MEHKCEGSCEEHTGEVKKVQVVSAKGYDWGTFHYCETAVAEDEKHGFAVTEVTE